MPELYDPSAAPGDDPLDGAATMPSGTAPTTAPDIVGPITLTILSCLGLSGANLAWRQGDTQPPVKLQFLDGNGSPIALAGATVTLYAVVPGTAAYSQTSVMTVQEDGVTVLYERQEADFTTVNAGRYYFVVRAVWPDGTGFSGPDATEAVIVVEGQY